MRNGLSLKPSLAFLLLFVKHPLTQLKIFDNMAMVLNVIKMFPEGGKNRQGQRQKLCYSGEQLWDDFKIKKTFYTA
jgi:hypothetical protein